jgi:hypothetical protein
VWSASNASLKLVGGLLGFELQQHAVEQDKLLAIHPLDLLVQDGFEALRRDRRGGVATFHAEAIHPHNQPDKPKQRGQPAPATGGK